MLFVEIDSADAYRHLIDAPMPPSAVVASGSKGHVHCYWQLEHPVDVKACESGNRRLAAVVAGDPMSVDAARILRPPGTFNHKREPTAVRLEVFEPARVYDYQQIVGHLADPKAPAPARTAAAAERPGDRPGGYRRARTSTRDPDSGVRREAHRRGTEHRRQGPLPVSRQRPGAHPVTALL